MALIYVFVGGGLGSLVRYILTVGTRQLWHSDFPLGTIISNLLACLILGVLVYQVELKHQGPLWLNQMLLIGFCGGFSTFSTFGYETVDLLERGLFGYAIANVLISVIAGIGLIYMIRFFK